MVKTSPKKGSGNYPKIKEFISFAREKKGKEDITHKMIDEALKEAHWMVEELRKMKRALEKKVGGKK